MNTHTFKGGIHPPERKELSNEKSIQTAFPSTKMVYIPVTQGGAPNLPIVTVGDVVARGQKIAETDAFMSAPVHSSVAGIVKSIENRLVGGNTEAPCIVIEADGSDKTVFLPILDPFTCSKEESLARVRQAGIVGMGGAAFPTHVKLNPPAGKVIDCILVNGAECEPYLTIDERTMIESADLLVDGLTIVMHITGAKTGIIVIEDNKTYVIPILEKAIEKSGCGEKIGICLCQTKYPQGGERNLVQAAVGREIPRGGLPADIGCIIHNIATLCALSDAFREGKPLIDTAFTVSGGACLSPTNLRVPVGTLVSDLLDEHFTVSDDVKKVISGGPMMGFAMRSADFPVQKNTSGVLFLTTQESNLTEENPCINCGRCIDSCSCRLTPVLIARALKNNDIDTAKKYGLMDCVDCGTCSYVCPSNLKLVQKFRLGKMISRKKDATAKAKADAKAKATAEKEGGK